MQLNNQTMVCEPCPIGFYKMVSANDTNHDVMDRFRCKPCQGQKTTYDVRTEALEGCIGKCFFTINDLKELRSDGWFKT
jgi:hypothetical protein